MKAASVMTTRVVMLKRLVNSLRSELEAERQRAGAVPDHVITIVNQQTEILELTERADKAEAEIAALKGDQVPYAYSYNYAGCETCEGFQDWRKELSRERPPEWMVETGKVTDLVELFTAQQKPVEVADSIAMQNVKDIAHCLSDIRRFVEAKFMTVGDLPSPEGLLLSGPEWKHESDAIIAALNRVADFYESQHVLKEIGYEEACLLSPNNDRPDITHGFKFGWNAYHKAAIEAAGGIVKGGEL
ncbi:MAG: hypothetical protein [Caudoviricetes sp.]|nr:MAG: hypothetical protein [Caudoviricetes sp.]